MLLGICLTSEKKCDKNLVCEKKVVRFSEERMLLGICLTSEN
jgi:hypothetical protein